MSDFNYDKILTGSPVKRLIVGYNNLKENFNESSAKEYSNLYKDKPLSFILENSEYIFTEPYYGKSFYEDVMINKSIAYPKIADELDKIDSYIYTNESSMGESQKNLYLDLREKIHNLYTENYNKCIVSGYGYETSDISEKATIEKLWDDYYNESKDDVEMDYANISNPSSYFSYIPDVIKLCKNPYPVSSTIKKFISESAVTDVESEDESFIPFSQSIFLLNKLSNDKTYAESVKNIPNMQVRMVLDGLMKESVSEHLAEMRTVKISEEYFPESSEFAATHLFDDFYSLEYTDGSREYFDNIETKVYTPITELLLYEYSNCEDTSAHIVGYESIFDDDITYQEAVEMLTESDKTYDDITKSMPKSLTTSIQTKGMDAELKYYKSKADTVKKGSAIKRAAKAVTSIPENISNSIKGIVQDWDKADDDRRKKYITKPGFRKKIFHNLKLAIMYGATATVDILLVPALAIIRHFSKMKDRRIRNQTIRELETEIKITDEKINDANSNSDADAKYKLMRIRSKLEEELLRIKSNSKYV